MDTQLILNVYKMIILICPGRQMNVLFRSWVPGNAKLQKHFIDTTCIYPVDKWPKLNRHKIILRCPGRQMNVLCMFYLGCVPMGVRNCKNALLIPHIFMFPVDTRSKLNSCVAIIWRPGHQMNILWVLLRLCDHGYTPHLLS